MEYVISKSFTQFQHEQQLPQLESRLRAVKSGEAAAAAVAATATASFL